MLTPQPKRSLQSSRVPLAVLSVSLLLHALVWWSLLKASPPPAMPEGTIEVSLAPPAVAVAPQPRPKPRPPAPRPKVVVHKPRTLVNRIEPPKPHLAQRPVVLPPVPSPAQVEPTEPLPVIQPEPTIVAPAQPERTTPIVAKKVARVPQKVEAPKPVPAKKPLARPVAPSALPIVPPASQPPTTNSNSSTRTNTGMGTGSGSGSGNGTGSGSGSGSGSGQGSGEGSGSGSGSGSGEGSGKGSGQGSGEGSGSGSGNGSGKGSGNGDGNGDGDGSGGGDGDGSGGGDGGSGGGGGGGGPAGGGGGGPAGGGPFGMGGQKAGEGPRRIMYVLDISNSMENRIGRAERELRNALAGLQPEESFGIVAFYGRFRQFKKKLLPANPQNIGEANRFLDGLRLDNGTNLEKALKAAFSVPNLNVVVIITDGIPTYGEQDFDKLAAKVRQMNRSKARIDTVALTGSAPEGMYEDPREIQDAARLLRQLAQESGGESSLVTIGQ